MDISAKASALLGVFPYSKHFLFFPHAYKHRGWNFFRAMGNTDKRRSVTTARYAAIEVQLEMKPVVQGEPLSFLISFW